MRGRARARVRARVIVRVEVGVRAGIRVSPHPSPRPTPTPGAFVLRDVLSGEEAARMVATAERMGFEVGEGAGAGRTSAAVSWCFHEGLAEQLIRRMAPHLPWAVAIHSPDSAAPRHDQLPDLHGAPPWVRRAGGVPEGMYTLDGLNCRMRVYRYEGDGADRFLPHYDEVWPGSRLGLDADSETNLEQDGWRY